MALKQGAVTVTVTEALVTVTVLTDTLPEKVLRLDILLELDDVGMLVTLEVKLLVTLDEVLLVGIGRPVEIEDDELVDEEMLVMLEFVIGKLEVRDVVEIPLDVLEVEMPVDEMPVEELVNMLAELILEDETELVVEVNELELVEVIGPEVVAPPVVDGPAELVVLITEDVLDVDMGCGVDDEEEELLLDVVVMLEEDDPPGTG